MRFHSNEVQDIPTCKRSSVSKAIREEHNRVVGPLPCRSEGTSREKGQEEHGLHA